MSSPDPGIGGSIFPTARARRSFDPLFDALGFVLHAWRAALGLVHPTHGGVRVGGMRYADLRPPLTHVGAVLDAGGVNGGLSGRAHLRWMCRSNRIPKPRIDTVLDRVAMAGAAGRRVSTYSLGMKQRLGIAAALPGDPPILIFTSQ